eukprot:321344_1
MSKGSNRTFCIEHDTFEYITFLFMILPAVLIIPILWNGLRESSKLTFKPLQVVYCATSFFLFAAAMIRPFSYYLNVFDCYNLKERAATSESSVATYNISLICISILYTIRVYSVFRSSLYSLSKCTIFVFSFTILFQIVLAFFTSYFNHLVWTSIINASPQDIAYNFKFAFQALISFRAINMVCSIALLALFCRKTAQIWSQLKQQHVQHRQHNRIIPDALEAKRQRVAKSVTVYTICLSMATVSTLIVNVFGIFRTNVVVDTNELYLAHQTSIQWDIFINALTIYLQFDSVQRRLAICCMICNWNIDDVMDEMEPRNPEQTVFIDTDETAGDTTGDTCTTTKVQTTGPLHPI